MVGGHAIFQSLPLSWSCDRLHRQPSTYGALEFTAHFPVRELILEPPRSGMQVGVDGRQLGPLTEPRR